MNAVTGGKQHNKPQSGLGGLASSFLGGQSHGSGGQGGTAHGGSAGGGIAGQLIGSFLGGNNKPQNQQNQNTSSGYNASPAGTHGHQQGQQGGLMGMASSFLGGHHGSPV